LSDSKKEVAKQYGAAGMAWPKRMTFIIDKNGKIEKIYNKLNVNTHAEQILDDLFPKK
jgi:peroxiredoxin|tara:strand:- start:1165 stop:1338 length:174 start_codon:yes stop_codon:yes gene_type:complete